MEQIVFRVHVRVVTTVCSLSTPRIRKFVEVLAFVNTVFALMALWWLHYSFVSEAPFVAPPVGALIEQQQYLPEHSSSGISPSQCFSHFLSGGGNVHSRTNENDIIFTGGTIKNSGDSNKTLVKILAEYDVVRIHITDKQYDKQILGREHSPTDTLYDVIKQTYSGYIAPSHDYGSIASKSGIADMSGQTKFTRFHSLFDDYLKSEDLLNVKDAHILASKSGGGGPFGRGGGAGQRQLLHKVADRLLSNGAPVKTAGGGNSTASAAQSEQCDHANKVAAADEDEMIPGASEVVAPLIASSTDIFSAQNVYLFSLEKGHLLLSPDFRDRHNITHLDITIPRDSRCFGGAATSWLVHEVVGYDIVLMNWLRSSAGERGYLYNVHTKELFNINYSNVYRPLWSLLAKAAFDSSAAPSAVEGGLAGSAPYLRELFAFKAGVMFTTLFLFFTATTLVSFVLRETQERMLKFTFLLQHHIAHRVPFTRLVVTHVVESLVFVPIVVGILFFLFEFFSDQLLAFLVLSVVWVAEVYSVICLRTTLSINFFPRIFFFYFVLFHIYFFSYPFGFAYLALLAYVLMLAHAMIHFWNKYEVPALEGGYITAVTPRMGYQSFHIDNHTNSYNDTGVDASSPQAEPTTPARPPARVSTDATPNSLTRTAVSPSPTLSEVLRSPPRSGAGVLPPFSRRPLPSSPEGQTWQSRTLQQTLNSTNVYSGGRVDDFRNYVEMSRRIQQQQMSFQFGHLGLCYPVNALADRNSAASSSTRSVSEDGRSNRTFLGSWVGLIGKGLGLGGQESPKDGGEAAAAPVKKPVRGNSEDDFFIGLAPTPGVSDNESYSENECDARALGCKRPRVRCQSEEPHKATVRSSNIRKQRTRSYPLQSFPSIGSVSSSDEGLMRRPSVNDFGYRKNSFQIFGNDFEED